MGAEETYKAYKLQDQKKTVSEWKQLTSHISDNDYAVYECPNCKVWHSFRNGEFKNFCPYCGYGAVKEIKDADA